MHHPIKLTHKTKKTAHDSQTVRAKENFKLSHGGLRQRRQAPANGLKPYLRAAIEPEA